MNSEVLNIIRDFVNDTKNLLKDNLIEEYIFGSYVKNTQNKLSDIDILIIVKNYTSKLRSEISSLSSNYSLERNIIISPIIKNLDTWEKNKKYKTLFYSEIKKHGIKL